MDRGTHLTSCVPVAGTPGPASNMVVFPMGTELVLEEDEMRGWDATNSKIKCCGIRFTLPSSTDRVVSHYGPLANAKNRHAIQRNRIIRLTVHDTTVYGTYDQGGVRSLWLIKVPFASEKEAEEFVASI